ncbi:MAG: hypothetical protein ACLFU7_14550 [Armatimonadota bacterium]
MEAIVVNEPTPGDFVRVLERWPQFAERYWWEDPERPDLGCFGTGYNNWGVQTNQKYLGAMAVLAAAPDLDEAAAGMSREQILDRALRALRFSIASHVSGDHHCADGTQWGHTWISLLGVERMMHGVEAIDEQLTDEDRAGLRRMFVSEADALLDLPITATKWAADGGNRPESNLWNGAFLARTARMYPDEDHVNLWTERGTRFLLNSISIEADADDDTIVAGKPLSEWHIGPQFFDNYALDHHGYLNVGYMHICMSNMAMLHFACETAGWEPPEGLYHHGRELWDLMRRLLFADGRLCRIGGDSRQRYCYCQDYLLPSLLLAGELFGDEHAAELEVGALELIRREQEISGDGSFMSHRLARIERESPYYFTRLEADKAVVLSMNAYWRRALDIPTHRPEESFEESARGGWIEPEHGAVMHRSPRRIASWSWRAWARPQGLCLPPDSGDLAEWDRNMAGLALPLGAAGRAEVLDHEQTLFEGGFVTWGVMDDSAGAVLAEGWKFPSALEHRYAVAALPDERTMVVLEHCVAPFRCYLAEVRGLKLNVPNDVFNSMHRTYASAGGSIRARGDDPASAIALDSRWACVDDTIGVVGVYGADGLTLHQAGERRASGYAESLFYDELCFPCTAPSAAGGSALPYLEFAPGEIVLDCASIVLSGANAEETAEVAESVERIDLDAEMLRGVLVPGADGARYAVLANVGGESAEVALPVESPKATDCASGEALRAADGALTVALRAGECRVLRLAGE